MLQPRDCKYLAAETLGRHTRRELGRENLDDDLSLEVVVLADEYERHAATGELPLNGVRSAESGKEAFGDRGHWRQRSFWFRCQPLLDTRKGVKGWHLVLIPHRRD